MADWFTGMDFEGTIKDFDFTKKAQAQMRSLHEKLLEAEELYEEEADVIAGFLLSEMQTVSFKDFLKRYIYHRAGIGGSFTQVPDKVFSDIIIDSFKENATPQAWKPTTKRWSATAKDWLTRDSVRRKTIFLIGFGLAMPVEDVSEFLTKVIKEEDFDFKKPDETIFWYCYKNSLKYPKAEQLLLHYESLEAPAPGNIEKYQGKETPDLSSEKKLMEYLASLKAEKNPVQREEEVRLRFLSVLDEVKEVIARQFEEEAQEEWEESRHHKRKEISFGDIERIICSGIPLDDRLNLKTSSASKLTPYFKSYRMTRQRLDGITKGRYPVERFDFITLEFFLLAKRMEDVDPTDRFHTFMKETNGILAECGMMELYPVNPYEAFVMICCLSEFPLDAYNEVWEAAYQEE